MTEKRGGLGRNLSALLTPSQPIQINPVKNNAEEQRYLSIHQLQPGKYQPRSTIEDETVHELASSIKQQGLLQPLIVREIGHNRYEIIAGERRWRACQIAELTKIPVLVRQVTDEAAMVIALIENLQREDLNPIEQARAINRLVEEFNLTHQNVAELLCKSRAAISNDLRLLSLNEKVRQLLERGDLDRGHARALLTLTEEQQCQLAELIVAKNLSVRETEKLVARMREGQQAESSTAPIQPELNPLLEEQVKRLAKQLKTKIKVKPGKKGKGALVIHYDTLNRLEAVLQQLALVPGSYV